MDEELPVDDVSLSVTSSIFNSLPRVAIGEGFDCIRNTNFFLSDSSKISKFLMSSSRT